MKKIVLAIFLTLTTAYAATLDENVTAVEDAASSIDIAIRAKRGTTTGGLKNAAQGIMSIPDNIEPFSQEYAIVDTKYIATVITNYTDCQYLDYMQFIGGYYFNTKIVPNSNTTVECEIAVEKLNDIQCVFGSSINFDNQFQLVSLKENNNTNEYTELEYIQFTGSQYINTEIVPLNHFTEIKYYVPTYVNDSHILGTSLPYMYYHWTEFNNEYHWGRNGTGASGGSWTSAIHILKYNEGPNYSVILDGITLDSGYEIAASEQLYIGRRDSNANYCGNIYYCKITDKSTGQLVRNFIPVKDQNGIVCMYDKISKNYFYNSGSGNFNAGPIKYNSFFTYKIDNDIGSNSYVHDNSKYIIRANKQNCNIYNSSMELVAELVSTGTVVDCVNPLGLFCCLNGQACIPTNIMSNVKFYSFKVYDNDNLLCHLIPAKLKDKSGNYTISKLIDLTKNILFDDPFIISTGKIEINNNSQWKETITDWTPSTQLLKDYTILESYSNWHVDNGIASMYILVQNIKDFSFYINSYAEGGSDFTRAYNEDDMSTIKITTQYYQYDPSLYLPDSGTGWKKVSYSLNLDGEEHKIKIDYKKDSSVHSYFDRGFIAIPFQNKILYGNSTNQTTILTSIITNITAEFVAYSTNITGAAQNKIIIDDAANKIYDDILK